MACSAISSNPAKSKCEADSDLGSSTRDRQTDTLGCYAQLTMVVQSITNVHLFGQNKHHRAWLQHGHLRASSICTQAEALEH